MRWGVYLHDVAAAATHIAAREVAGYGGRQVRPKEPKGGPSCPLGEGGQGSQRTAVLGLPEG